MPEALIKGELALLDRLGIFLFGHGLCHFGIEESVFFGFFLTDFGLLVPGATYCRAISFADLIAPG